MIDGPQAAATVTGLTINGPITTNSCASDAFGVLAIDGATANLTNDHVTNIQAAPQAGQAGLGGCQYGVAVQVGRKYWPVADRSSTTIHDYVGTATITGTTITGYQKNGITVDGPGSSATIHNSQIDGGGPTTLIGRNGIQISRGATGTITANTIKNNQYTGTGNASDCGVLTYGGAGDELDNNVVVNNNTLTNNDIGICFNNYNPAGNAPSDTANNDQATNNTISNSAVTNVSGWTTPRTATRPRSTTSATATPSPTTPSPATATRRT